MAKQRFLVACAFSVLALASASPVAAQVGGNAGAQDAPTQAAGVQPVDQTQTDGSPVREVVVTGSLIQGTAEDAALPVDVIGAAELAKQGSPSPVELLKNLPTSSGVLGDSNQFDSRSQGAEGIASANLRGLSPQRTLVLLNSRRLTTSGNGVPVVDLNLLPQAAIGRVEVLKDGAAATYGSDAVAGVINFITRTDQEGFQVAGNYRFVKSTDGDVDVSLSYGHRGDNWRFLVAAGFQKRGELLARERDFAVRPFAENPQGGFTGGGNPANFIAVSAAGAPIAITGPTGIVGTIQSDTSCAALGGFVGRPYAARPTGQCYTQYSPYDALVDLEKRGQAFVDFEVDLTPSVTFQTTLLYGRTTVPHYLTSPSYILTQSPSPASFTTPAGTSASPFAAFGASGFFVPSNNPGLVAYRAANPAQFPGATTNGNALFPTLLFRPFLAGGNPLFNGDDNQPGSSRGGRKSESFRATGELRVDLSDDLDLTVSGTYHDYFRQTTGFDSFGDRVQRALLGFGGFNCSGTTPGANGCLFLNPFGNQSTMNPATGAVNPQGTAALANSLEVSRYIFQPSFTNVDTELFVGEASISGSTGLTLPGGDVKFGIGGQYRHTWLDISYGANSNIVQNPCRESPINGNTNPLACSGGAAPNGAFAFLGTGRNNVLNGGIYAVFGELQIPVFDALDIQLGARFEDYGGQTGSTFNPQARARFQALPWLAFRGGIGTTFRGPTLPNLDPNRVTALQLIGSAFRPVDVFGNPALKPEKSTNYSGGILLSGGGFSASLDYYRYKLREAIIGDPLGAMVATLFPTTTTNTCATNAALAARFTFTTAGCAGGTAAITRVTTRLQNGPEQINEGVDLVVNFRENNIGGSDIRAGIGGSVTYVIQNSIGAITVAGVLVQQPFDGVGLLNYQSALYPVPEYKGQAFIDFGVGPLDARFQVNYTGGLHDQRSGQRPGFGASGPFIPNNDIRDAAGNPTTLLQGADIDKFVTADLNVQMQVMEQLTLTGTITNLFDQDPPFAREDYNYEPFIGNPLGRTFKVGLSARF
ncbi:MAG: TonB-dependent receptor [Sphingomonas bacterium]|uniref:TonB-dependent receptor domain-containing protein n=1 Tax=Sphingomonas bacterium TaxID=1895847 RepID=UPI002616C75A|nr:TonB-dependent receptor [Sphingomonas bacterium]MDB5695185.1 TonB-dependent receptor [Sphingomonas bacterium]